MLEVISYRLSATGIWGYAYYRGREYFGETACEIGRSSTVRMTGEDIAWYSPFRIVTDIVPGVSRRIMDNVTEEELYRVIFWQPGLYEFTARTDTGGWSMIVEEVGGRYMFVRAGMPVAAVMERLTEAEWIPPTGTRIEPAFRTTFYEQEDSPGFLMMVLSFPALKMI